MERLLSKRKQFAKAVATATEHNANEMVKSQVKRKFTDSAKCSRNEDVVVDPVTGYQTVCFFSTLACVV